MLEHHRSLLPIILVLAGALTACGGDSGRATGVATNPPLSASDGAAGSPGAGGAQATGARTVLSPIGLNIRDGDAPTAPQVGTAGRGALLTVLEHSDRNGGWYKVKGQTTTGWITADPDLTAPGHFSVFSSESDQFSFSALYPDGWTFVNEPGDVLFKPQSGPEAIVARPAPAIAALGPTGRAGYSAATQSDEIICGVTGTLVGYDRQGGASATSAPATPPAAGAPPTVSAPSLAHFAQLRLRLDAAHALELDYNYDAADHLQTFRNFYHSVTFPIPQCVGGASPSAAPAAPAAPAPAAAH